MRTTRKNGTLTTSNSERLENLLELLLDLEHRQNSHLETIESNKKALKNSGSLFMFIYGEAKLKKKIQRAQKDLIFNQRAASRVKSQMIKILTNDCNL